MLTFPTSRVVLRAQISPKAGREAEEKVKYTLTEEEEEKKTEPPPLETKKGK